MDYSLLKQLLEQVETFEQHQQTSHGAPADLARFAAWLHARTAPGPGLQPVADEVHAVHDTPEAQITKMVLFLNRYARSYVRLALADTVLLTIDDFAYLASLYRLQPLSKTELITRNVHEKASGTEVIKRLLAHGLVWEEPHATDRRRKLLSVTDAGREVLGQVIGRMNQVAQLVSGDLTADERQQLVYLLQRLDAFHQQIYQGPRPESFASLTQQWLPPEVRAAQ